jgi:hypothetical protein
MMATAIERNKKLLVLVTDDIKKTSTETDLIRHKLLDSSHNWNNFDASLTATLLKDNTAELRGMILKKLLLEEQLTPSRTYTTRVIDKIYVTEGPVSPKKFLIIGLAILLGLFGAVVIAFVHNALATKSSLIMPANKG